MLGTAQLYPMLRACAIQLLYHSHIQVNCSTNALVFIEAITCRRTGDLIIHWLDSARQGFSESNSTNMRGLFLLSFQLPHSTAIAQAIGPLLCFTLKRHGRFIWQYFTTWKVCIVARIQTAAETTLRFDSMQLGSGGLHFGPCHMHLWFVRDT